MTKEAAQKFGSLYQYGVEFMEGFDTDADAFLAAYKQYENKIKQSGYSRDWDNWKEDNEDLIIRLFDNLNAAGLIPTSPVS
jgi:hypothetical protein